jgi:hypothetical protein
MRRHDERCFFDHNIVVIIKSKVKISLLQAMEAHRVARG